jgi:hypothetical protein
MNRKIFVFAMSMVVGIVIMNMFYLGNVDALKDEDERDAIVTVDNVKGRDVDVSVFIYDKEEDKVIKGSPNPIATTAAQVKHTFKFDNDDFPQDVGPGTEIITCIEFKNGNGEKSCLTDRFKSDSQPFRVTMDADYIRDD